MFLQVNKQEQARVGKSIDHKNPLQNIYGKNANNKSWNVATHCIPIKTRYLLQNQCTSGKGSSLDFMNLNMKKRMMGTPAPKLKTKVTAYLTNYNLKKYPLKSLCQLNFDSTQLAKLPTIPSSSTKVVKIQKGPQKSGFDFISSKNSPLQGGTIAALILFLTISSFTLKYSS